MLKTNNKYEILKPTGWKDFVGVQEIKKQGQTHLTVNKETELLCSPLHRINYNGDYILAKDIPRSKTTDGEFVYYDIVEVDGHEFFTNGIVSHNCEFLGSSGTLIAGWKLKELVHQTPLLEKEGLIQYSPPEKDHLYMMVCDVSRGKGLDYSAFQLIDVTQMPYKQACIYRSNAMTPVDYAEIIHRAAKGYNNAAVLVEVNDIGEQVSHTLHYDFGYENVLFTENAGRSGKRITGGFGGGAVDKGIRTTKIVKSVGCSILKLLVEQNQLLINDFHTINEFSTFSKKGNSYEAEPNKHDDLIMCLVLFAWLSDQQYFKDYTNINTLMSLKEKTDDELEQDMAPFGFIIDGRVDYNETIEQLLPDAWMWENVENF